MIDYTKLPPHMRGSMQRYYERGIPGGNFLTAILENRFVGAILHADEVNLSDLENCAIFLAWEIPTTCWGSPEKVRKWIESGGAIGMHNRKDRRLLPRRN